MAGRSGTDWLVVRGVISMGSGVSEIPPSKERENVHALRSRTNILCAQWKVMY